jgi:hypothetical protein
LQAPHPRGCGAPLRVAGGGRSAAAAAAAAGRGPCRAGAGCAGSAGTHLASRRRRSPLEK